MRYHLDIHNDWARSPQKHWSLAITRCFLCLSYGGGEAVWSRFAAVCKVAEWLLSYDTLPSALSASPLETRIARHGELVWCLKPPTIGGIKDTRLFLLRTGHSQ